MTTLTVRDVPEATRDALAQAARARGQSLQAYLLATLERDAAFLRNTDIMTEVDADMAAGRGVRADAPDAADVIRRERAESAAGMT